MRVHAEPNTIDEDFNSDEEPHPNKLEKTERAFNEKYRANAASIAFSSPAKFSRTLTTVSAACSKSATSAFA